MAFFHGEFVFFCAKEAFFVQKGLISMETVFFIAKKAYSHVQRIFSPEKAYKSCFHRNRFISMKKSRNVPYPVNSLELA